MAIIKLLLLFSDKFKIVDCNSGDDDDDDDCRIVRAPIKYNESSVRIAVKHDPTLIDFLIFS